jgi:predicted dehydrogenase
MGNQGYSNDGARECAEIIWNGDIGNVTEVHAWTDRPGRYWPQSPEVEPKEAPVPAHLDWDAWLGSAPARPFSPAYAPHHWRGFPEFGCGAIGDMACHILGTPNMAMRLSLTGPTSVECVKKEGVGKYCFPHQTVIRFDFPARGSMGPLKLFWYDSLKDMPKFDAIPAGQLIGDKDINGSLFIGDKGMVTTGCYGEKTRLMPDEKMADYKGAPKLLTRSPGHYRDWIRACKGGDPACSNFSVAGPFVEWMLLGVIAMRYEGKLEWDNRRKQFTNNKEANKYLKPEFRKGYKFNG